MQKPAGSFSNGFFCVVSISVRVGEIAGIALKQDPSEAARHSGKTMRKT